VYFDLIGLPPTTDELERARIEPWEQTVDRLLASPHFGERLAVDWLDAARYADTDGYFGDKPRQMWLWRDWVINAFNQNMPFDQFTIEQLAGDLLPDPTIRQRIANGFNRNHMSNDETGLIDEEYRVEYVADRVDTTLSTALTHELWSYLGEDALTKGEKVTISDFGTFTVSHRNAFKGHNPKNGQEMHVPERRIPVFRAGKGLKNALNPA